MPRAYDLDFRLSVVNAFELGIPVSLIASAYGIPRITVYRYLKNLKNNYANCSNKPNLSPEEIESIILASAEHFRSALKIRKMLNLDVFCIKFREIGLNLAKNFL